MVDAIVIFATGDRKIVVASATQRLTRVARAERRPSVQAGLQPATPVYLAADRGPDARSTVGPEDLFRPPKPSARSAISEETAVVDTAMGETRRERPFANSLEMCGRRVRFVTCGRLRSLYPFEAA